MLVAHPNRKHPIPGGDSLARQEKRAAAGPEGASRLQPGAPCARLNRSLRPRWSSCSAIRGGHLSSGSTQPSATGVRHVRKARRIGRDGAPATPLLLIAALACVAWKPLPAAAAGPNLLEDPGLAANSGWTFSVNGGNISGTLPRSWADNTGVQSGWESRGMAAAGCAG